MNKIITIKSQTEPDFKIKKKTPSKSFIDAKIVGEKSGEYIIEKRESEKPHYLIEIILHSEAAIGNIGGVLEHHTNSITQSVIRIPIFGEIE